ncbi:MAG: glycosyltransferase family 2 protein [Planctomycetota bacterium]
MTAVEAARESPQVPGGASVDASVLVVSYNTRDLTLACIRSVFEETAQITPEVIVVDNASSDGSAEAIEREFPEATVLALDENIGFGAACNRAAQRASGRHFILLNPDARVLDGALDRVVEYADGRPDCGIVGGRTLHEDGSLNPSSCWGRPTLWSLFCQATCLSTLFPRSALFDPTSLGRWERDEERDVPVVSGCFLLVPREHWERLGGFDESFFMYGEDVDLSLRSAALGRSPRILPTATVVHVGAASEPIKSDKLVRLLRAQRQLIRKHWSPLATRIGLGLLSTGVAVRAAGSRGLRAVGLGGRFGRSSAWGGAWARREQWR